MSLSFSVKKQTNYERKNGFVLNKILHRTNLRKFQQILHTVFSIFGKIFKSRTTLFLRALQRFDSHKKKKTHQNIIEN